MKYYVSITETLNRVVGVEAESEDNAVSKVAVAYGHGEIELDSSCSSCFVDREIKLEDDQDAWRKLDEDGCCDVKSF